MKKKPARRLSDAQCGISTANLAFLCGGIGPHVVPPMKPPDRFSQTDYSRPLRDKAFPGFQFTYMQLRHVADCHPGANPVPELPR
jgi:hypothetical protein